MIWNRRAMLLLSILLAASAVSAQAPPDVGAEVLTGAAQPVEDQVSPEFGVQLALDIGMQLGMAFLLSLAIAAHPMRLRRMLATARGRETVAAQILITVAGAIMVIMIGNSLARAFGLVGLGSFIRFRTNVKSPKETALMFVCIGLGMGCGLGQFAITTFVTAFIFAILFLLERRGFGALAAEFKLELKPAGVEAVGAARRLLEQAGAQIDSTAHRASRQSVVLRGSLPEGFEANALDAGLGALTIDGGGDVEWSFPES